MKKKNKKNKTDITKKVDNGKLRQIIQNEVSSIFLGYEKELQELQTKILKEILYKIDKNL